MASLMSLPTEIRPRIWRYVVPYEMDVLWDEFVGHSQLDFPPNGEPIMMHPVAYASHPAAGIRLLCRQAYAEFQYLKPPRTYCPRLPQSEEHTRLSNVSHIFIQSISRMKIIEDGPVSVADVDCVKRLLRGFVWTEVSPVDWKRPKRWQSWVKFERRESYTKPDAENGHYDSSNDLYRCNCREMWELLVQGTVTCIYPCPY